VSEEFVMGVREKGEGERKNTAEKKYIKKG